MPRPTGTSTTFSLSAIVFSNLFPQTLSGEELLNGLGMFNVGGYSAAAQAVDGAAASHLTPTLHNDDQQRPPDALRAEIRQLPADATADRYQLLLRPWLWCL